MLIMHNNKYLPLTGLYLLCCSEQYSLHCIILHLAKYFDIYGVK